MAILHQNTRPPQDELSNDELTARIALLERVIHAADAEMNALFTEKLARARARDWTLERLERPERLKGLRP